MTNTANFNLKLPEGTDKVNPLVDTNPNFEKIDEVMKANQDGGIQLATESLSGTVHAIVYTNKDGNVFRFKATSNYTKGDTFTVNGVICTATTVSGESLPNNTFVINSSVLCILDGTKLTVIVPSGPGIPDGGSTNNLLKRTGAGYGWATGQEVLSISGAMPINHYEVLASVDWSSGSVNTPANWDDYTIIRLRTNFGSVFIKRLGKDESSGGVAVTNATTGFMNICVFGIKRNNTGGSLSFDITPLVYRLTEGGISKNPTALNIFSIEGFA